MREEVVSLGPFTNSADDDVPGVPAVDASSVSVLCDTFADDATSASNKQHPSNGSNGSRSSSIIFDRAMRRLLQRLLVYIAIPSSVGIAAWLITGHWTQHQCSSHIAQMSPPLLWDSDNDTYTKDPELSHVFTGGSISVELLLWTSLGLPLLLLSILPTLVACYNHHHHNYGNNNKTIQSVVVRETAAVVSAFLTTWYLTLIITDVVKVLIHRPRPNYYSYCKFDWDTLRCQTSSLRRICGARYSFPSGHSSLSACGMVFVCCYIVGKVIVPGGIRVPFGHPRHTTTTAASATAAQRTTQWRQWVWSVAICILACSWAVRVAQSRVHEHWHRVSDVSAGLTLGTVIAAAVYGAYFGRGGSRRQHRNSGYSYASLPTTTNF